MDFRRLRQYAFLIVEYFMWTVFILNFTTPTSKVTVLFSRACTSLYIPLNGVLYLNAEFILIMT